MRLRRKRLFDFDSFDVPIHATADVFSRMWRSHESIRREEHRDDELEQIADLFHLKGLKDVCHFLRNHRSLIPVLVEARQKFDDYFGEGNQQRPKLEIFTDPGDSESAVKLLAFVRTTLPFFGASQRLERLHEEWWFEQSDEAISLMNIGVEYVDGLI